MIKLGSLVRVQLCLLFIRRWYRGCALVSKTKENRSSRLRRAFYIMARYNKQADIRNQQARSFRERERMIEKHYGSWTQYDHLRILHDMGKGSSPKSPETYIREENARSGF